MAQPNQTDARLNQLLDEIDQKLRRPNELLRDVHNVPTAVATAYITGRAELVGLIKHLTEADSAALLQFIGALIETNRALVEHANQLSHLVGLWMTSIRGMQTNARRIEHFANFQSTRVDEDSDE